MERCKSRSSIESDASDIFSLDAVPELQPFMISNPDSVDLRYSVAETGETGETDEDISLSDVEIEYINESEVSNDLDPIQYEEPTYLSTQTKSVAYATIPQDKNLPVQETFNLCNVKHDKLDDIEINTNELGSKSKNDKLTPNTNTIQIGNSSKDVRSSDENNGLDDIIYSKEKKHTKGLIGAFRQLFKSKAQSSKTGQQDSLQNFSDELSFEDKKETFLDDTKTMVPLHFRQQFSNSIRNERCLSKILEEEFSSEGDDSESYGASSQSTMNKIDVSSRNNSFGLNSNSDLTSPNSLNQTFSKASRSTSDLTLCSYLPSVSLPESLSQTTLQLPNEDEEVILKTLSIVSKWEDSKWQRFSASHMIVKVTIKKSSSIGFIECSLGSFSFKFAVTKNTSIRRGTAVDVEIGSVNCEPKCEQLSKPSTLMFRFYNSFEAEEFALNADASRKDITSKVFAASTVNSKRNNSIFMNRSINSSTSTLDKYVSGAPSSVISFNSTLVPPKLSKQMYF